MASSSWLTTSTVSLPPIPMPLPVATTPWPPEPDQPQSGAALSSPPDDVISLPPPLPVTSTVSPAANGPVTSLQSRSGYPCTISSMDKPA